MLDQLIAERWVTPKATVGLWRCKREGDDVLVLAGNDWTRLPFLRQQVKKREGRANMCLADFISPDGEDWIGGFAVGIHGLEPHLERFKQTVDDYDDILLKALADRLAESLAEVLHAEVRNRLWGYADEHFSNEQLIREKYEGIRPAPGYPACPDHSLKPMLFQMLGGNPGEVTLTENFAMLPTSAVSGFYFGHRDSQYFGVARIGRDQLEEYAERRGFRRAGRALASAEPRLALASAQQFRKIRTVARRLTKSRPRAGQLASSYRQLVVQTGPPCSKRPKLWSASSSSFSARASTAGTWKRSSIVPRFERAAPISSRAVGWSPSHSFRAPAPAPLDSPAIGDAAVTAILPAPCSSTGAIART